MYLLACHIEATLVVVRLRAIEDHETSRQLGEVFGGGVLLRHLGGFLQLRLLVWRIGDEALKELAPSEFCGGLGNIGSTTMHPSAFGSGHCLFLPVAWTCDQRWRPLAHCDGRGCPFDASRRALVILSLRRLAHRCRIGSFPCGKCPYSVLLSDKLGGDVKEVVVVSVDRNRTCVRVPRSWCHR